MKILKRLAWLIPFTLVGAIVAFSYIIVLFSGKLEKWQAKGGPPDKAVKILARNYVETESGLVYRYQHDAHSGIDSWVLVEVVPSDADTGQPIEKVECFRNAYFPSVDNFVDSKAFCYWHAPQISVLLIAIDKSGDVYYWGRTTGEEGVSLFAAPFFGGVAGFIIGLVVVLLRLYFDLLDFLRERAVKRMN